VGFSGHLFTTQQWFRADRYLWSPLLNSAFLRVAKAVPGGHSNKCPNFAKPFTLPVIVWKHSNTLKIMTRLAFLLLYILLLTGCTSNDQVADKKSQKNDTLISKKTKKDINSTTDDTNFRLDFFKSVPDTIDGCGEYFTYDTSKIANDKYIFLSNLTDFAIIKINGKNIYLNRDAI
jgi:hypothetical protein